MAVGIHIEEGEIRQKALKGGGAILSARIFNMVFYTSTTVILARLLDPSDYGLVAMVTAVTGFFSLFNDLGLTDATIQYGDLSHGQASNLFWINAGFGFLLALLFMVISPAIASFYGDPRLKSIAMVVSTGFLMAGLSSQLFAVAKRNLQFAQLAKMEIAANICSFSTAIVLGVKGAGYWSLVFRQVVIPFTLCLLIWRFSKWRPGLPDRKVETRPLLGFGANSLGSNLILYLNTYLDKILIGRFLGPMALGFYHNAFHLFIFPLKQLSYPFIGVAVSSLSKLRDNPRNFIDSYIKAIFFLAFIGMPVGAFLAATGGDIIGLLLGPAWEKTAVIFSIFGLSAGPFFIYSTVPWIHLSLGKADRKLKWSLVEIAVFQTLFIVGLFTYGTEGVAMGYSLAIYILIGPAVNYAGKPIGLDFRDVIKATYRFFLAAACAGYLVFAVNGILKEHVPYILVRLLLCGVLMTAGYCSLILILDRSAFSFVRFWRVALKMFPQLGLLGRWNPFANEG
jgi:O-antigen/teichoic acid export membrane protein